MSTSDSLPSGGDGDRRDRDLQRKLDAGKKARDIGPIPDVEDLERRTQCSRSFRLFCETYFSDAFYLEWSDDHLRVLGKIESVLLEGGLFAFGMPRGSGKSTLCRAAVLFALLYGLHSYVVLVAASGDLASKLLRGVKRVLMANARIGGDFPEACYPLRKLENNARKQVGQLCQGEPTYITWADDELIFPTIGREQLPASLQDLVASPSCGSIISVAGLDSAMRGQQHTRMDGTVIRPSLFLGDDPQTRKSAGSLVLTRQRLDILYGDVLGMAGPGQKISGFVPCTKIYEGDLADQLLDPKLSPEWQGECTKMIYQFPSEEALWDEYAELRAQGMREGDHGKKATEFYRKHRKKMDKGAKVAWPARYDADEISAVQHGMNLRIRNEEAFFAEYQNEPVSQAEETIVVSADAMMERVNQRKKGEVPGSAAYVSAYIDVQEKVLFYLVAAWQTDFTGCVIDYGTYPDQKRRHFSLREAKRTLKRTYQGAGTEGAIHAGLLELGQQLLGRNWPVAGSSGSQSMGIERLLVDSGYLPGVVADACRQLGGVAMPAKGKGITASMKPMAAYHRRAGERHGHHWYVPNVSRTAEVRHVLIDTNYWKSHVHRSLGRAVGDPGALTLWGKSPTTHRMLAEHVCDAETCVQTEGQGRILYEFSAKPSKPDNHLFDCLTGAAAAASMLGAGSETFAAGTPSRKRISLSKLQQQKKGAA